MPQFKKISARVHITPCSFFALSPARKNAPVFLQRAGYVKKNIGRNPTTRRNRLNERTDKNNQQHTKEVSLFFPLLQIIAYN